MQSEEVKHILARVKKMSEKVADVKKALKALEGSYGKEVLKFSYINSELQSKDIGEHFPPLGLNTQNVRKCIEKLEAVGLFKLTRHYPSTVWIFQTEHWIEYLSNINNIVSDLKGVEAGAYQLVKQTEEGDVVIIDLKQHKRLMKFIACLSEKTNARIIITLLDDALKKKEGSVAGMMNKEFFIKKRNDSAEYVDESTISFTLNRMAEYKLVDRVPDGAIDGRIVRNSINLHGLHRLLSFIENHHFQTKASRIRRQQKAIPIKFIRPNNPVPQQS